jgi:hypothetical protein
LPPPPVAVNVAAGRGRIIRIRIVSVVVVALGVVMFGFCGPAGDSRQSHAIATPLQSADASLLLAGEFPWQQKGH